MKKFATRRDCARQADGERRCQTARAALASRLRGAPLFPFVLRQIALGFVQIDVHALGDGPPVDARKIALPIQHACDGAVAPDER